MEWSRLNRLPIHNCNRASRYSKASIIGAHHSFLRKKLLFVCSGFIMYHNFIWVVQYKKFALLKPEQQTESYTAPRLWRANLSSFTAVLTSSKFKAD